MNKDIARILLGEEEINAIVARLAKEIDNDYRNTDKKVLLLAILKGSVVFMGELMKKVTIPVEIDFMKVSSYGAGTQTSGNINIILDLVRKDIEQYEVIIVEDIVDSGKTLSHLSEYLRLKGAHGVKTCTLLDKPSRREVEFTPDYIGREVEDEFVVGYGLDYDERYRALPYVGILKPEVYTASSQK